MVALIHSPWQMLCSERICSEGIPSNLWPL